MGVPVTVTRESDPAYRGQLISLSLGPLQISQVCDGPAAIARTPWTIQRSNPGHVNVCILVSGSATLSQDARWVSIGPGDLVICDTTRPYQLAFPNVHRSVVVTVPRGLVRVGSRDLAEITARAISGDHGLGALVSPFLTSVVQQLDENESPTSVQLSDAVIDLLQAMFVEQFRQLPQVLPERHQRALLLRIQSYIEGRLGDPGLRPEAIANAHYISERYLQKLFKADGVTVTGYVRDRRLDRCRRDLLDPGLGSRPVAMVGVRWGLTSPAHFSRAFKAAYGCSPREFRANVGRA